MWEIIGYSIRESNSKHYCNLFLGRSRDGVTGKEVKSVNYCIEKLGYEPVLGDCIIISEGVFNGRIYVSEIHRY